MAKKMTPREYENSKQDRSADRAGAKKSGMSMSAYEGSAADKKADSKGMKKMNKGRGK